MGEVWPQWTWAEKWWAAVPLSVDGGSWVPHLTQCRLGRAYLCTKWHLDPSNSLATISLQQTIQTGRTTVAYGEPLLVTVAEKLISSQKSWKSHTANAV